MKKDYTEEEKQRLYEKYRDKIERLTLMDDEFMVRVFDNDIEATELVLRIILGRELKVISARAQTHVENLRGRSVRLDVSAEDSEGRKYDIEIQRDGKGAGARRARFYSGIIDANALVKRQDFDDLAESYVIFITESDVLGGGLPIYHIERTVAETGRNFGDGSHIIYVNGERSGAETELGRLMHDFKCSVPAEMNFAVLKDKAQRYKAGTEVRDMSGVFDEFRKECFAECALETKIETAIEAIKMGLSSEQILRLTGLPEEKVIELQREAELVMA